MVLWKWRGEPVWASAGAGQRNSTGAALATPQAASSGSLNKAPTLPGDIYWQFTFQFTILNPTGVGTPLQCSKNRELHLLGVDGESTANSAKRRAIPGHCTPNIVYKIANVNSGMVLAVQNELTSDGAQIQQYPDTGTNDHIWQVRYTRLDQAAPLVGWQLSECFITLRRLMEARLNKHGSGPPVTGLRHWGGSMCRCFD